MKFKGYGDEIELQAENDEESVELNRFFVNLQNGKSASGKSAVGEVQIIKTEGSSYAKFSINVE